MSYKHNKPATAKETAAQKKAKKAWDKMTPAEKKRVSTSSTSFKRKTATQKKREDAFKNANKLKIK